MLTDIFSNRYHQTPIFLSFAEPQRRLLVQSYRLIRDQLPAAVEDTFWGYLHDRISMELGLVSLALPQYPRDGMEMRAMSAAWFLTPIQSTDDPDPYSKDRLSFVELAFRRQAEIVAAYEAELRHISESQGVPPPKPTITDPVAQALRMPSSFERLTDNCRRHGRAYREAAEELNARLRQAGAGLHYHNGFLQISGDLQAAQQIEAPFWAIVGSESWANVDHDMKEAVDARDTGGRDPAWYAARALESTLKIISRARGWTTGRERGAQNFVENLARGEMISPWEAEQMKLFFSHVRNALGHGPGDKPMPELPPEQTDWAIEFCMSWIKLLVRRHEG